MTIALHGLSTMHRNLLTDIRIAHETGRECRRRMDSFLGGGRA